TGVRSVQKALLFALLQPDEKMKKLQNESNFTEVMYLQEEMKTAPFGDVWNEYLARENVTTDYLAEIKKYEQEVLVKRV
ncbi:MAG: L-rhamnose isomerase, partial [Clostridia bacterium]|nr:L-rhamnose isomerase [Clostridia bacterium]